METKPFDLLIMTRQTCRSNQTTLEAEVLAQEAKSHYQTKDRRSFNDLFESGELQARTIKHRNRSDIAIQAPSDEGI